MEEDFGNPLDNLLNKVTNKVTEKDLTQRKVHRKKKQSRIQNHESSDSSSDEDTIKLPDTKPFEEKRPRARLMTYEQLAMMKRRRNQYKKDMEREQEQRRFDKENCDWDDEDSEELDEDDSLRDFVVDDDSLDQFRLKDESHLSQLDYSECNSKVYKRFIEDECEEGEDEVDDHVSDEEDEMYHQIHNIKRDNFFDDGVNSDSSLEEQEDEEESDSDTPDDMSEEEEEEYRRRKTKAVRKAFVIDEAEDEDGDHLLERNDLDIEDEYESDFINDETLCEEEEEEWSHDLNTQVINTSYFKGSDEENCEKETVKKTKKKKRRKTILSDSSEEEDEINLQVKNESVSSDDEVVKTVKKRPHVFCSSEEETEKNCPNQSSSEDDRQIKPKLRRKFCFSSDEEEVQRKKPANSSFKKINSEPFRETQNKQLPKFPTENDFLIDLGSSFTSSECSSKIQCVGQEDIKSENDSIQLISVEPSSKKFEEVLNQKDSNEVISSTQKSNAESDIFNDSFPTDLDSADLILDKNEYSEQEYDLILDESIDFDSSISTSSVKVCSTNKKKPKKAMNWIVVDME